MRVGYNPKGGKIKTDANVLLDRAFLKHYHVAAADAVAASNVGVLAATGLTAAVQTITALVSPAVPRNAIIKGNVSGLTTKVTINGKAFGGKVVSEELTLNGASAVAGTIAFESDTSVVLPIRTHAPAYQKTTSQVTHAADKGGTLVVTVTAAAITSPKDVSVVFAASKTVAEAAALIAAALNLDATVGAAFLAAVSDTDKITLTAKAYAAQDATINLVVKTDADTTAVTIGAITVNTTAGVAVDTVSVGWGDIFGLPDMFPYDTTIKTLFNKAADSMTIVTDVDEIEKNTFDMTGTADGLKDIDIFYMWSGAF